MQKIKTYFKVLFASLNPVKAKKYFLGFSIGQSLAFLFISVTFFWLLFLYLGMGIVATKITHSKVLKQKTTEVAVKVSNGLYYVLKQVPFTSMVVDPINKQIKVTGLQQPYVINFYIDNNCSLKEWQQPPIKFSKNALLVFCPHNMPLYTKTVSEILDNKPIFSAFINTNEHAAALDAVLNRTPGFVDVILTSDYLDIGTQQGAGNSATYKTQKVYFKDIFTENKIPNVRFTLFKGEILTLVASFIKKIPNYVNLAFSTVVPQLASFLLKVLTPILAFVFILVSFVPIKSFVLFFNLTGSVLLGAFLGFIISQIKPFNKTAKDFKSNFLLGALATTTLFLYRFLGALMVGTLLLFTENRLFYILIKLILLNSWVYVLALASVIFLLKLNATKQLQQIEEVS